jgi:hypothetical protein
MLNTAGRRLQSEAAAVQAKAGGEDAEALRRENADLRTALFATGAVAAAATLALLVTRLRRS